MPKKSKVSSSVTNVANTGARQVSRQTTGATGPVSNTIRQTATKGASGAPGTSTSSFVNPEHQRMIDEHVKMARSQASSLTDEAFARAEGHLAQARQTALGAVPAQYRDLVNSHFDRASAQIEAHKKRRKS